MKQYFLITISLLCILCTSCNNDDDVSVPQQEMQEIQEIENVGFFNLKVGNVWTYEYFRRENILDEASDFMSTGTIEEREIIERIEVNGEMIYTFQVTSTFGENDLLSEFDEEIATYQVKDSLGYLVRIGEGIVFSSEDEDEYLIRSAGFGDIFGVLLDTPENVMVPAGDFNCAVNDVFAILNPSGEMSLGRNSSLIAEEVGEVLARISFVTNPIHIVERRLISFHFEE